MVLAVVVSACILLCTSVVDVDGGSIEFREERHTHVGTVHGVVLSTYGGKKETISLVSIDPITSDVKEKNNITDTHTTVFM
jgi:hypothetical protein